MQRVFRHLLVASCLAGTAFLSGCTEQNSSGNAGADPTLTFAITDAASDDVESFTVEVTQLELQKLGGGLVNVLAAPATVDLATLTEMSQILSVGNVPIGTYVSATITLDFTNSSCMLVGQSTPATIVDIDGNPVTGPLVLPVDFGTNRLVCPANRHKLLVFDFDLNQSVTTDTGTNTVTIEPAFAMHLDPSAPKPLLAVGTLVSADPATSSFVMEVRTLGGTLLSTATFHSGADTIWHIDGASSQGAVGLAALDAMPAGTWVQLAASVDPYHPQFDADYVEAGHGTYSGGDDIVEGHVVDRVGAAGTDPILTVLGNSSNAAHTVSQVNTTFTVSMNFLNTNVLRTAVDQDFDTDDLNVGQRVRIFGALTGVTMDATTTTSVVKMLPTRVLGFASAAPVGGLLTIDLARIDLRPETDFNWPVGGLNPTDPDAFKIEVGNLGNGLGIVAATPVEARGFFAPVDGLAENFVASSLTNRANAPSLLLVRNRPAGMSVELDPSPASIAIDVVGAPTTGEFAIIDAGFVGVQNLPTTPRPTMVASVAGPRFYAIVDKGLDTTTIHLTFADFSARLDTLMVQNATVVQVGALGVYSDTANSIAAQIACVVVE